MHVWRKYIYYSKETAPQTHDAGKSAGHLPSNNIDNRIPHDRPLFQLIYHLFSSAWVCQQGSNRNLSVAHLSSMSQLSEPNASISVNFWLLLPLGYALGLLFNLAIFKLLTIFFFFFGGGEVFKMWPCGSKKFKTLLTLQINK